MEEKIKKKFLEVKESFNVIDKEHFKILSDISKIIAKTIKNGNKIILFGNGGSAADSQHIACELVGKFSLLRNPYPAISLTTNTSNLTAIANDFSFSEVFKRQVKALGKKSDLAWGITTSGNSENVIEGIKEAKSLGLVTITFTGGNGGRIKEIADYCFIVPVNKTPRIQEFHILSAHIICELIEEELQS